ncbi:hypothetical protein EXIGLDRAFT_252497 [Exidia glandulosa HHB12029]|uniref:Domain of unknown function at the cortex 1 domain-containing protein n=1 Tax=Exidia glandulosa HHB12029 TaxID=1314781 RepID=A0A165MIF6_EXIGL|nr:hypothetical protein EXIGLDRAFT_252497 [Exidia glandulosa HHB12029]
MTSIATFSSLSLSLSLHSLSQHVLTMPGLRIYLGPSIDEMKPVSVNDGAAHEVANELFQGRVSILIRNENEPVHKYFTMSGRERATFSIQMQGRFLEQRSANSVLFGIVFKKQLKLPWGTSAAMQFVQMIDPTLKEDISGRPPWVLSPLLSGMPHLTHETVDPSAPPSSWPPFPQEEPLEDTGGILGAPSGDAKTRRKHFTPAERREAIDLKPTDLLTADLAHGHIHFPALQLKFPGGITFDCAQHWEEGQMLIFVCCERPSGANEKKITGPGRMFWCVGFELLLDGKDGKPAL